MHHGGDASNFLCLLFLNYLSLLREHVNIASPSGVVSPRSYEYGVLTLWINVLSQDALCRIRPYTNKKSMRRNVYSDG